MNVITRAYYREIFRFLNLWTLDMQLSYIFQKCILYNTTAVILSEYVVYIKRIFRILTLNYELYFVSVKKECTVFLSTLSDLSVGRKTRYGSLRKVPTPLLSVTLLEGSLPLNCLYQLWSLATARITYRTCNWVTERWQLIWLGNYSSLPVTK